ncbi:MULTISPECIES: HlyD family secretion protein [unclassified Pseudoalteromonas]|uniref:HlyD family secretion protein n=1 Tax=unclassified Pseudoalteromonas TaxID=194690 RepID=UPI002359BAA2|nr:MULTISPECIES: HlyD family secretion protein [unclassified Pseudoalteromonas]MDC9566829.1 HlyD family secretion protein [Pseudoalteromonas sp. GAB2316C]MDC9571066.1 HlyD family secretion protein [Pseudoalteromonas sp. GABNB9D]MDC9575241.1 HlyD family secretion protein [Pseudoalteromonas sp. GABNS16A]MDC9579555.1 HlyD family secretion protein [Pseudoalteromonas sp. GABNS16E]MDC9587273.1 HlyD family secretion protein [Pseudoalteromonas sp. GABNS16C]
MALPKVVKLTVAATILAVVAGSIIYLNKPESQSATQTTDDAYVQADFTFVAPQVSGTVDQVLIKDNQRVQKGDLIATIDNRDFVVALDSAKAQANSAKASVASLQAKLTYQDSLVQQAQAAVEAGTASLKLAQLNLKRYTNLATDGSGTVQAREEAQAKLAIQKANLHKNQAGLAAAKQQIEILRADIEKAKAVLVQAKARVVDAELKLSYTQITAPIDGIVGQKSVRVGAYVNPGSPLLVVVPLEKVFVSANYRETQLANVKVGQEVEIKVDALPGKILRGHVDSLSPASGVSYSAIGAHNATGNFTKIVQRLPVKISLDANQPALKQLRVGMSVVPSISITQ